jgi:hypothetical protein
MRGKGDRVRAVPSKLRLRGPADKPVEMKTTVTLARKRDAAKRATALGVDLATWQRMVIYQELDRSGDKGGDHQK